MNVLERSRRYVKKTEAMVKWALLLIVGPRGWAFASPASPAPTRWVDLEIDVRSWGRSRATPAGSGQEGEGVFRNFGADWLRAC